MFLKEYSSEKEKEGGKELKKQKDSGQMHKLALNKQNNKMELYVFIVFSPPSLCLEIPLKTITYVQGPSNWLLPIIATILK